MQTSLLRKADAIMPALLISILLALFATARADDGTSVSILYHESIQLIGTAAPGQELVTGVEIAPLSFDAYGRRFELLPDHERSRHHQGRTQLHGRLTGLTGSWFSLLRNGDELSGIISDGTDIYLIEPSRRIAELLIEAPADSAPANLIFRLADMLIPRGWMACTTQDDPIPAGVYIDGQSAVDNLSAELQASPITASAMSDLPLLVGVVADESFVDWHGTNTETEIEAIFITVQGIIFQETGLELEVDSDNVLLVPSDIVDPFSDTVIATELLGELGDWRRINQAHLGHTHLITSREEFLSTTGDDLAGISYLGTPGRTGVCNPRTGASVSYVNPDRFFSPFLTALIITHEIGHNLGAPHDGDPESACASTSATDFLMGAKISTRTPVEFSDCSTALIDEFIAASCLNEGAQTLPVNSSGDGGGGGGGGSLSWLSITGLLLGIVARRRRSARFN